MSSGTMIPANGTQGEVQATPSSGARRPTSTPPADVFDSGNAFTMLVDMPGVNQEELSLTLERNVLSIHGQTSYPVPEGLQAAFLEFVPCNYKRTFVLSDEINGDAIEASIKDGVLRLILPKSEKAQLKKIPIKTE